jgi:hypothetical protein
VRNTFIKNTTSYLQAEGGLVHEARYDAELNILHSQFGLPGRAVLVAVLRSVGECWCVLVVCWWYVGDVLVVCWWCVGGVLVMCWWCVGDVLVM